MNGFRLQFALIAVLLFVGSGCHCCCFNPVTEKYCDAIDDFSDRRPWADRFYHAKLDLTRLGRSDGPECCQTRGCEPRNCR